MHIVVIGWLFVAFMIAIGQKSVIGGLISFTMWGVVPVGLMLYIFGRRRASSARAPVEDTASPPHDD